ncbi:amidohydrolase family protein [Enterococcus faecalis]
MSYVTHYDFWRELDYFVSYGKMNPIEVLKIATQNNAKLLGIETKCGCIKEGFTADIIILSENPLENIRNLENIDMVFKRGRLVKKKKVKKYHEIDSLLCEILPR